ncbi:MAG: coproporphyrinogen dehydrogenase HemZ [Oscillospiraceae bacterium]|jgi:oxygen-independent coproporphyrinogen-3 oxidase|nr:coproporphyrinogen dehydrogenase HemZ [Oscillospiraceae bacterium]
MILLLSGHSFRFELENICRVFFPDQKIGRCANASPKGRLRMIPPATVVLTQIDARDILTVCLYHQRGKRTLCKRVSQAEEHELCLAKMLYVLLRRLTGYTPPWGLLTGVRPSKLMLRLRRDCGADEAVRYFQNQLWVSPAKTALAQTVALAEEPILAQTRINSFSLYISIPFCPSRCSYCSFVSQTITRGSAQKLIPDYINALCDEIAVAGTIAAALGLRLESCYIGGGTPSILDCAQLAQLFAALQSYFDMQSCKEFSFEAGRPDTITPQKLDSIQRAGIQRLSINPQSMSDDILRRVGRLHTAEDIVQCYERARSMGFKSINMDLIAGLPRDTAEGFRQSLLALIALRPQNITVHTLALKRAADLAAQGIAPDAARTTSEMLAIAQELLPEAGYAPYYMYRQSKSLGNLENIGWALPHGACRYNIDMMEESHTILGCGAGAVTKLKDPHSDKLERVFSLKYPYEYLTRFQELLARKERIKIFYLNNTIIN